LRNHLAVDELFHAHAQLAQALRQTLAHLPSSSSSWRSITRKA
jgi:hypothetical protein